MRLELPLILVFLAYVASDAYQPYFNEEQYPYHYNNPYYRAGPEDLRQIMFSLGLPSRQTVTVTSTVRPTLAFPSFPSLSLPTITRPPQRQTIVSRLTSTSTITCTKSTSVPCSVVVKSTLKPSAVMVKLNSTIEDQETTTDVTVTTENEEQFTTITPSIVQKVETTKMPSTVAAVAPVTKSPNTKLPNRKGPNRKGRAVTQAEWLSLNPDFDEDYLENQPHHDIESAFYTGPYDPIALPFFRRNTQPNMSQLRQSSFLDLLGSFFGRGRSTLTVFEIKTATLTPTCSVAGPLPQCPNI